MEEKGLYAGCLGGWTCGICAVIFLILAFLGLFILFPVLMAYSFADCGPADWCIKYHTISKKVDTSKIYTQGKHYVQPGEIFLRYKNRYVTREYTTGDDQVKCLSKDGVLHNLRITIQFRLFKEYLFDILWNIGEFSKLKKIVDDETREAIKDTCSNFTANEFNDYRGVIQRAMESNIEKAYVENQGWWTLGFLQLQNINQPKDYVEAILAVQEAEQDINAAENERPLVLVQAYTNLTVTQREADEILVVAHGEANGILAKAAEEGEAIFNEFQERATSLANVKTGLAMTTDEFLDYYLRYLTIEGSEKPIIQLNT